jgi:hypothetical protein
MKQDSPQFPNCDSCGKSITGEAHVVKSNKALLRPQNFHKTPEECSNAETKVVIKRNRRPKGGGKPEDLRNVAKKRFS